MCRIVIYECDDVNYISRKGVETVITCNSKSESCRRPKRGRLTRTPTEITISHGNLPILHKLIFVENEKDEDFNTELKDLYGKPEIDSPLIKEELEDSNISSPRTTSEDDSDFIVEPEIENLLLKEELEDSNISSPRTTSEDDSDFIAEPEIEISLIEEELMDSNIPRSTEEIELKQDINKEVENIDESSKDPIDPPNLQCPNCKKIFSNNAILTKHMSMKKMKFKCSLCCRGFKDSDKFKIHMGEHTGDGLKRSRKRLCKICKLYVPQDEREKHMLTHGGKKDHPKLCHICSKVLKNRTTLSQHLRKHKERDLKKSFLCVPCNKTFPTQVYLQGHNYRIHNPIREFRCSMCEKILTSLAGLQRHMKMHTGENLRNYKCMYCNKGFLKSSHVKRHEALHVKYEQFDGKIDFKRKSSGNIIKGQK